MPFEIIPARPTRRVLPGRELIDDALNIVFVGAAPGAEQQPTVSATEHWLNAAAGRCCSTLFVKLEHGWVRPGRWLERLGKCSPPLRRLLLAVSEWPLLLWLARACLRPYLRQAMHAATGGRRPDLIVAIDAIAAQCIRDIAATFDAPPPTMIMVSEYRPHRAWLGRADVLVLSQVLGIERAREFERIDASLYPVPLLPSKPAATPSPHRRSRGNGALRMIALQDTNDRSTQRLMALLKALDATAGAERIEVEIVCHNDVAQMRQFAELKEALEHLTLDLRTAGQDLPVRMAHADVALVRASSPLLTDALTTGLPVLAYDWQSDEAANLALLDVWEVGYASQSIEELITRIQLWLDEPASLAALRRAARDISHRAFGLADAYGLLNRLGLMRPAH